jgi:hypothetical protein
VQPDSNGKLNIRSYFHYFDDQRKVQAAKRIKLNKLQMQKKEAEDGEDF